MRIGILVSILFLIPFTVVSQILQRQSLSGLEGFYKNSGIAVADFDQDGHEDIYIVAYQDFDEYRKSTWSRLLKNNNDASFNDVTIEAGLLGTYDVNESLPELPYGFLSNFKHGASWGDYNNDGYPDLFLTNYRYNKLYLNNTDGSFKDVTEISGIDVETDCYSTSALWFDYNNDGWLDLLVSSWALCDKNFLYESNQDGTFTDVSDKIDGFGIGLNQTNNVETWMTLPLDINSDNWIDLLFITDYSQVTLLVNNAGVFQDKTNEYGLFDSYNSMGATLADFDNDGIFEILTTDIDHNSLWVANGLIYNDIASNLKLDSTDWSWNVEALDLNLDGLEDIIISNGYPDQKLNYFFENKGGPTLNFENRSEELPDKTYSMSFSSLDFDHDGDLDLLFADLETYPVFYENTTINSLENNSSNWFKVKLEGTNSNRDGIGTKVQVTLSDNSVISRFYTGAAFMSQSLQPVHFGLGESDIVKELRITWPSGHVDIYQDIPANNQIKAVEGDNFYLDNYSNDIVIGCTDPNSCSYNPEATLSDGSCVYLESKMISGPSESGIYHYESYSYPGSESSSFQWSVENGTIKNGQSTNQVLIQWAISDQGKVTVTEVGNCTSKPVELMVDLTLNDLDTVAYSIARYWNEVLLEAIRNDFARPTIHARNLFHISAAMYDSWQLYKGTGRPYFMDEEHEEISEWVVSLSNQERDLAINTTMSYAVFRLLEYRFRNSPGYEETMHIANTLFSQLGLDSSMQIIDYKSGDPAELGNYIANKIIEFGKTDGSNEVNNYANRYYSPVNGPLLPNYPGNPDCNYPNNWQPLQLSIYIDQSGNLINDNTPEFLGPEWGNVTPFALNDSDITNYSNGNNEYLVFNDPGSPPRLNEDVSSNHQYQWGFSLVSIWGSHLDPTDGVIWDISPAAVGNIPFENLPDNFDEYNKFYDYLEGGDPGKGHLVNPVTNEPYQSQLVPRADYARVLAEFWADGPNSETPPGHWFTILNYVNDYKNFQRKFKGEGKELDDLEWDVKSYFTLGGAMHDAAISAWSIKGWYDYIRPISAIRYMAGLGQSTDVTAEDYHEFGIPLVEGYIERVDSTDPLAGVNDENVGKIKLKTWRGHDFIDNTETDFAGVGWILAENWWPYQRPSFVTPPFAGYVSGHSTYSRAAAEVLTLLTGSNYFPGGMGEFVAAKNEFLVFEDGPSVDVKLQWATYQDASDQCSLSRIWGGIHPPSDDIPGRIIGYQIGHGAFELATEYFKGGVILSASKPVPEQELSVYPNPTTSNRVRVSGHLGNEIVLTDMMGRYYPINIVSETRDYTEIEFYGHLTSGVYIMSSGKIQLKLIIK